ncbi:MAG: PEP-CTERM sorting domain-containing protein [Gemmatimonadota bacterium]
MKLQIAAAAVLIASSIRADAQVVHTSSFISGGYFNDFETMPNAIPSYTAYSKGGITAMYIGVASDGVQSTYLHNGTRGWYPGGDVRGYTSLTLTGGGTFSDVEFAAGDGWGGGSSLFYQMLLSGNVVATGLATNLPAGLSTVGFSGVTMDELRVQSGFMTQFAPTNDEALALDDVHIAGDSTPTPEPATLGLLSLGLAAVAFTRRHKRTTR